MSFGRFVAAQDTAWPQIQSELAAGRKVSHWMWYAFPQLARLGRSERAKHFGIADLAEAQAYLAHPLLGPRLVEAARLILRHAGERPETILGTIDSMKLRSSMTLFAAVPGADSVFSAVLEAFFHGSPCPLTQAALKD